MGYVSMTTDTLYELFRRWQAGQKSREIAIGLNLDRKTVRKYVQALAASELVDARGPDFETALPVLSKILEDRNRRRSKEAFAELRTYAEQIRSYLNDPQAPLKPKSVYQVLVQKHDLGASYSTFKRFMRTLEVKTSPPLRIEWPPGQRSELDYGVVGAHEDAGSGKKRRVHAFCNVMAMSRLPFVEFVYTQTEVSFVESNVHMCEFYGGVTQTQVLDNLKAGVIRPSLYDPLINRSYAEMLSHYGTFADPCRVASPKDKPKVERFIPTARELFRRLKHLYPQATLAELNAHARTWCLEEYGMRNHGTTGLKPLEVFLKHEKPHLKPLPDSPFEIAVWKEAKVHPDRFIQFERKHYAMPPEYIGQKVWVRKSGEWVKIFSNAKLIRTYRIPKGHRAYDKNDFPEVLREMLEGGYPKFLLEQARPMGEEVYHLIEAILTPHAYLNARRAQGVLQILKENRTHPHFDRVIARAREERRWQCGELRRLFEMASSQESGVVCASQDGKAMMRDIDYYIH
jgi:transposase